MWDIVNNLEPNLAQEVSKYDAARHTITVIVAPHRHLLMQSHSTPNAFNRLLHVWQKEGVMRVTLKLWIQETLCGLKVRYPARKKKILEQF